MCRDGAPECGWLHATESTTSERVLAGEHATYVNHNLIVLLSDVS